MQQQNLDKARQAGIAAAKTAAVLTIVVSLLAAVSYVAGLNPVAALIRTGYRLRGTISATWAIWSLIAAAAVAVALNIKAGRERHAHKWNYRGAHNDTDDPDTAQRKLRNLQTASRTATGLAVLAVIPAIYTVVHTVNRWGHDSKHDAIVTVTTEEDGFNPTYVGRKPYLVAATKLTDSVGEDAGVTVEGVWRFDVAGTTKTCGLIVPQKNAWKRPISGVVCVDDTGRVERANFTGPQVPSWKVAFGKLRLTQVVNDLNATAVYTTGDIYGYVDNGKPTMVVPTTKLCGGTHYVSGWAGAVAFTNDGARLVTNPATLWGPVAGESLANEVLNGLNHRGGFLASRKNLNNFDPATGGTNPNHHLLARADGTGERLVTLLTPKGDSNTPVAALEIDPRNVGLCSWPKATLYKFPAAGNGEQVRASVAEAEQTVIQRYGAALQLENTKLAILETQLADADTVIVALGSDRQVMTYIAFNLQTRETVVYDRDRNQIRSDNANATVGPQGLRDLFVDDTATDEPDTPGTPAPVNGLDDLSDEELLELLHDIADELDRRRS